MSRPTFQFLKKRKNQKHEGVQIMSETMHIENMFVNHVEIKDKSLTWVKYTQASGLPDWTGITSSTIKGTYSTPYYTT